jgi:hypothetical protein
MQAFCTLIILALVGNMIHEATHGNPSVVNYQIFVGAFSSLSLIFLIASVKFEGLRDAKLIVVILDWLNTLFFFAGGVSLATKLGVHSCSNQVGCIFVGLKMQSQVSGFVMLLLTVVSNY